MRYAGTEEEESTSLLLMAHGGLDGICMGCEKWLCAELGEVSELKMMSSSQKKLGMWRVFCKRNIYKAYI